MLPKSSTFSYIWKNITSMKTKAIMSSKTCVIWYLCNPFHSVIRHHFAKPTPFSMGFFALTVHHRRFSSILIGEKACGLNPMVCHDGCKCTWQTVNPTLNLFPQPIACWIRQVLMYTSYQQYSSHVMAFIWLIIDVHIHAYMYSPTPFMSTSLGYRLKNLWLQVH